MPEKSVLAKAVLAGDNFSAAIRDRPSLCFPATFVICATINCFFAASAVTLNPRSEKRQRGGI
jgi:hypothetical protein